jgi:hypothetical protein
VYGWIWNHLPAGVVGRAATAAVLIAGVGALLWFVAFPAIDARLPTNNVQVTSPSGVPTDYRTLTPSTPPPR